MKEEKKILERRINTITPTLQSTENNEKRTVEGYAAVFNKESQLLFERSKYGFVEIIEPGAFDAVMNDDVRAFFNHDPNHLLARTKSGTLKLEQDSHGLKFVFDIPESRKDISEMIERGDLTGNSFAFFIGQDRWEERDGVDVRYIEKIDALQDISLTTFPAYPDTSLSLRGVAAEKAKEEIETPKEVEEKKEEENIDFLQGYRDRYLKLKKYKENKGLV